MHNSDTEIKESHSECFVKLLIAEKTVSFCRKEHFTQNLLSEPLNYAGKSGEILEKRS